MSDSTLNRRKTAMLLFEIEECFGDFVKKNLNDLNEVPESILDTLKERKLEIEVTTVDNLIERTYLSEIFQLASIATTNTSFNKLIKEIQKLAIVYELYDIRNAVAHPNRTFPNCYWYRAAAFASDPLIATLGIQKIHRCLISAEEGIITDPPDEWLDSLSFEIRNNLPKHLEHDITGLIGREKEHEKLISLLTNPRVNTVAVIAPGGYGKTALVLDMLQKQVCSPKTLTYADSIIFISLKIESLTTNGIKKSSAPNTIELLKEELITATSNAYDLPFENFEECKDYLSDQKVLLFIDNLETLLRDNPEAFDELNLELPALWRVLVTSRTMISSNQSITLEPLGKKHSLNLISSYIKKKGGKPIGKEFSEKIAEDCYFNPLAIRLTADKILTGSTIPTAISTTKNEIAEFSFRNLIDSISDDANSVMEALLLGGESEKIYLCSLLEFSLDRLSNALRELIPTSLLSRKTYDDIELFELSSSIRDLLLLDTKNISLREKILSNKEDLQRKASEVDKKQRELSISTFNVNYIPLNTNQSLKILLEKFHRCRYSEKEYISTILKEFKSAYETFKNIDIYQRDYARAYNFLRDHRTAVEHAKIAVEINPKEPLNLYILADSYFQLKDYSNSADTYLELIETCSIIEVVEKKFLASAYHGAFQSLLWKGDYQKIFDLTDDWENATPFPGILGSYRATAFKRSIENSFSSNTQAYINGLINSIQVMDKVFIISGYLKSPCIQSLKIIDEIYFAIPKLYSSESNKKFSQLGLSFIRDHSKGIIDQQLLEKNSSQKIQQIKNVIDSLKEIEIDGNPLTNFSIDDQTEEKLNKEDIESSYIEVKIYHVAKDPNKKFATDKNRTQYYLTRENTSGHLYSIWESISVGERLFIIPGKSLGEGKALPVHDILKV